MGRGVANLLGVTSFLAGLLLCLPTSSQQASPMGTSQLPAQPPMPSLPDPPTKSFRQLLAGGPAQRESLLAKEPPERQNLLRKKLLQYEAMPADRQEQNLRSLELRWYLLSLMPATLNIRLAWVAPLPASDRAVIASRLMYWDLLLKDEQQEVLTNEVAIRIVVSSNSGVPFLTKDLTNLPPAQRQRIGASLAHWSNLPSLAQQRIQRHFNNIFNLPDARHLADARILAVTNRAVKPLPPGELERVIAGYRKYTDLSSQQREEFIRWARVWQSMSEQEKEQWRQAVNKRPPPLPPFPTPLLPPMPPGLKVQSFTAAPSLPARAVPLTTSNQP